MLHLEVIRPNWDMPSGVVEDLKRAVDQGFVNYIANRCILARILLNKQVIVYEPAKVKL